MNVKLEKAFTKLEEQRQFILKSVSEMPEEKYNVRTLNKWAVSELLTHLIASEQLSVSYMKKKVLGIEKADDSGMIESFKMAFLKLSQRLPLKYTAPKIILDNTPEPFTLEAAILHWQESRSELKDLAENIPDKFIRKKIFKHPLAGRFDLAQAMNFFFEHIGHHWPQIKRLL